jgi:hypothetical protein
MKCPKCGYLGFEHIDRCRNCGYDFSLSQTVSIPDLPMRNDPDPINPLDDFSLVDAATAPLPSVPMSDVGPDLERLLGAPPASARARPVPTTSR